MLESFRIESVRKLSRKQLRIEIDELLSSLESATPEERELISYKADIYVRELDRKRDYWSWVSTRDLILEVIVIALIGWEIWLSYRAESQQARNFTDQQAVLTAMQKSTKDTAEQLALLKSTTEEMKQGVERNATAAEASSATAAKSLVVSERAYVTVSLLSSEPKEGEKIKSTISVINSGKTPAINLRVRSLQGTTGKEVAVEDAYKQAVSAVAFDDKTSSKGILGPAQTSQQVTEAARPLSGPEFTAINDGSLVWYVFVELRYDDTLGRHHTTLSCSRYLPERKTSVLCNSLNKAD